MRAYRDQYASLFNEGHNVVVMGISNDSAEEGASWLKDEDFPFLFASDAANDGATYTAFGGGLRDNNMVDNDGNDGTRWDLPVALFVELYAIHRVHVPQA